jgi:hypothetical protein
LSPYRAELNHPNTDIGDFPLKMAGGSRGKELDLVPVLYQSLPQIDVCALYTSV